jgi:hypothetical protein
MPGTAGIDRMTPRHRGLIEPVPMGALDQGMIFTCAVAEGYHGCEVFGIMITARCDIAHEKVPHYNYLPIVRLRDWVDRDLTTIACHRAKSQELGAARDLLERRNLNPSILLSQDPKSIADQFFPATDASKESRKARTKLNEASLRLETVEQVEIHGFNSKVHSDFLTTYSKLVRSLIIECARHRLTGYYFIPSLDSESRDDSGYVVLLRETQYLPPALTTLMAKGLADTEFEILCGRHPDLAGKLAFDLEDFCYPLGKLRSPEIEHLLQEFAYLFSRVGVADLAADYVEALPNRNLERP